MFSWFKDLFVASSDPSDVLKDRSVCDMTDEELYALIDPKQIKSCRIYQFSLIVAEILRRTRKP